MNHAIWVAVLLSHVSFPEHDVGDTDRRLRSLVRGRVSHREDAEDIAQESWLRISSSGQSAEKPAFSNFRAYLFRIARNLIVDHRRRAAIKPFVEVGDLVLAAAIDPSPDPETALITRAELARMDRIIAAMPDKPREVYRLSRIEGLSFAEIGRRLGVSRQTVHEHMRKALLAVTMAADADF